MSTLSILFADFRSLHMFDKVFEGKSAFDRTLSAVKKYSSEILVTGYEGQKSVLESEIKNSGINSELFCLESWNLKILLEKSYEKACEAGAENVIFSFADVPFLNSSLTEEILSRHEKYMAEYSFQDGYPEGLAPVVIAKDTLKILSALAETKPEFEKKNQIQRDSIFSLIKTEINSFEIETIIAPEDFRMYRLSLDCGSKSGLLKCQALFEMKLNTENPLEIASAAVKDVKILKTVPAFYNLQISEACSGKCIMCPYAETGRSEKKFMDFAKFQDLCGRISEFSENAVISLSAWGEALNHPDFEKFISEILKYNGLSVLVETDGLLVNEEMVSEIKKICDSSAERINGWSKIYWIVALDAFSAETYGKIRGMTEADFEKSKKAVEMLEKSFAGDVFPQMTRINQNEQELEAFYRFWSDKNNPSAGAVIVQKYDSFCETLPDLRPADISPLGRNICWHLLRDMNISTDGTVFLCHEVFDRTVKETVLGNVFEDGLENVWNRQTDFAEKDLNQDYSQMCRKCDEYYTFNF